MTTGSYICIQSQRFLQTSIYFTVFEARTAQLIFSFKMNSLAIIAFFAVAANAQLLGTPASTALLAPAPALVAAAPAPVLPALPAARIAPAQIVQQVVEPATVAVQVPVTRTVHYESRPVITGYSTQILKAPLPAPPAIPFPAVVAATRVEPVVQKVVAAPAPVLRQVLPAPVQIAATAPQVVAAGHLPAAQIIQAL